MCYHISLTKSEKTIEDNFQAVYNVPLSFEPYFHFNGWENKYLSIIKQDDETLIDLATWGVLPTNYNLSERKNFLIKTNTLNATSERLYQSNLFKQFITWQKCLIIADGFYEPHTTIDKHKIPHYFKERNHNLIAFAGIYSVIDDHPTTPIYSASIITREANNFFKSIHNTPNKQGSFRMPLILDPTDYYDWLNSTLEDEIKILLHTFTKQEIIAYPVSRDLFKTKINTNTPEILKEVPFIKGLF